MTGVQTAPYSIARAELVANQIGRFATQHLHQLAGHHANLAFWLSEAVAALSAIDGYQPRFKLLRDAQLSWVREHKTTVPQYCPICQGSCEFGPQSPAQPNRVPSEDLDAARIAVRVAVRQFVLRLHGAGFLSEEQAREAANLVGAAIEQEDLEA